ncbi:hypothetical protein [Galactobacter caseinivorans]|uniref:Uncharacterized protein n=1 Tax=Galactobacter caseinivorans TaxID=2676123 RepID=A0A496PMW1_9MICC|nr:hypothetical protein [Galactobacter caseinivorans]RKW71868.1 hypothetical protein DWQ67_03295 [Galactobacter caseinivorans]
MRRILSLLLLLMGAVGIVWGIGQVTFLAPAATLTAAVPSGVGQAPVTLITQAVRDTTGNGAKLSIRAEGEFLSVVGRQDDVDAWIGDSAANVISGVDTDSHVLKVEQRPGQESSPNPAGSDLWVSEEKHQGAWDGATWTAPADGDWTLMLATDGTSAAPMDISMTWDNPQATTASKWSRAILPLVAGIFLIALAVAIYFGGKKNKRRGGSDRDPAAPRTGQLRQVTVADPAAAAPSMIDARNRELGQDPAWDETQIGGFTAVPPSEAGASDEPAAPLTRRQMRDMERRGIHTGQLAQVPSADEPGDGGGPGLGAGVGAGANLGTAASEDRTATHPVVADGDDATSAEKEESVQTDSKDDSDTPDDDQPGGSSGPKPWQRPGSPVEGTSGNQSAPKPWQRPGNPAGTDPAENTAAPQGKPNPLQRRLRVVGGAVLATVALTLPGTPAWAETASPSPSESVTAPASSGAASSSPAGSASPSGSASESAAPTGEPVVVDAQLQRILTSVSAAAKEGDEAKDAKLLESRFTGKALELRKGYYDALKKKAKFADNAVPPISASPIRAAAVTTTKDWPRLMMVLTQGEGQTYPVAITLEQENARSNYKVLEAVPMVPEATFPGAAVGSSGVTTETATAGRLVATPAETLDGFADWLKDEKSSWAGKFENNVFVTQWRAKTAESRKELESDKQKGSFDMDFSVDSDATRVLTTPKGGSLVSGYITQTTTASAQKDGKITLPSPAKEFAGTGSTDKKVVTTYRMPVFFHIPAAGSGEKISLVGNSYMIESVELR